MLEELLSIECERPFHARDCSFPGDMQLVERYLALGVRTFFTFGETARGGAGSFGRIFERVFEGHAFEPTPAVHFTSPNGFRICADDEDFHPRVGAGGGGRAKTIETVLRESGAWTLRRVGQVRVWRFGQVFLGGVGGARGVVVFTPMVLTLSGAGSFQGVGAWIGSD
jgi:hypothetical protein